ncbi:aspartokinase-like protein [Beauveria bassiana ARSEF 2860]|uniref:Aspartokinase-like protein n=1 Tax=Beauveria bassiana (strain ARSEF 2860) TaxID=655819 RepID=J4UH04_BEAB2|nr:aspartokinase-like protein [Beauveria bassiana ARSEF 2860]EJP62317.1 aspartokinase-like protein [Beauveria bassiana ARSEF 2860]
MGRLIYGNDPELEWVVQKYGGTSIGKYAFRIAQDIIRETLRRNRVAVVCSARSTTSKVAGTTTRLIDIFNAFEAARVRGVQHSDSLAALRTSLDVIIQEHIAATAPSLESEDSRDRLAESLSLQGQVTVSAVAEALTLSDYDYDLVQDRLISLGEKLSCLSLLAILQDLTRSTDRVLHQGVEAEYVDLSTILPRRGPLAVRAGDAAYAELSTVIAARLLACGPRVPVITGFFGHNPGGGGGGMLASEIGRGYTDLCAALCAVGLGAAELQIWKEVDGIMTADPSRVARAQLIPRMSLAEAAALTQHGSEVVHALAIRHLAAAAAPTAITLSIRNVKRPLALGTIVRRADDDDDDKCESSYTDSDTDCASLKFAATFCRAITAKDDACILHHVSIVAVLFCQETKSVLSVVCEKNTAGTEQSGHLADCQHHYFDMQSRRWYFSIGEPGACDFESCEYRVYSTAARGGR